MIQKSIQILHLTKFKARLNEWRLGFLLFALVYTAITFLTLTSTPVEWDEVAHLNGGSFLVWGEFEKFTLSAFYPPLFDCITFVFFKVFGVSLLAGRLVPLVFSVLSLWVLFELAYRMYDGKTALLCSILLGIMPGYFWLSRMALLETMLVFFVTASLLSFYLWLQMRRDKMLFLTGLAIGLGFLTKYQMFVALAIIVVSLLVLARDKLRYVLKKFSIIVFLAFTVVLPWILIAYQVYVAKIFSEWVYAMQVGNPERLLYSQRYPFPIYYFIEVTWPYNEIHPISPFLYVASLLGLGLLVWRRRKEDKYVLIWFATVFVFFTFISNKNWRYILPLFPALALSTAVFILWTYGQLKNDWKLNSSIKKKRAAKFAAGLLIVSVTGAMVYSINDAYYGLSKAQFEINIEAATNYAIKHMNKNESIMVLCPFNLFSRDIVRFYLWADGDNKIRVTQYPEMPVDTYTPRFNITEFIDVCERKNVKYVFTYEHGGTVPYFNTTLNLQQIYKQLYDSGKFSHILPEATFGVNPRRIFILTFTG